MTQTEMVQAEGVRAIEREIAIPAPVDVVWNTLTNAEELMRWFPLEASVTPGVGGSVWMRWDGGEYDAGRITIWEPGHRLRVEDVGGTWKGIAHDYFLRSATGGEGTILRVVSSGFGEGASWDDTLDSFGRGWDFELRGLRHYLVRHRGQDRVAAWARAKYDVSNDAAWNRIVGPNGWLGLAGIRESGDSFRARTAVGNALSGVVELVQPPRQFAAVLEQWNDALFRVQLYGGTVGVWLSTYGIPAAEIKALEAQWQASLSAVFATSG